MRDFRKLIETFVHRYNTTAHAFRFRVVMPDGHGGQIRKQGFDSKEIALEWATNNYLKLIRNKGQVDCTYSLLTFREYGEQWFHETTANVTAGTRIKYRTDLDIRIYPFFGETRLLDLTKRLAKDFERRLQCEPSINNTTRAMAFALFKRIVKAAENADLIPRTGITDLSGPKVNRTTADHWDESERECFLTQTMDHPQHLVWAFALFSGMRAGEIAALKWSCIQGEQIEVRRSRCQKTGLIRETTKNGEHRFVPLFDQAATVLKSIPKNGEFVFGGATPMETKHLSRDLKKVAEKMGVKPITFHQLRHSFCSWLENNGLERRIVQEILGHRDSATTDRYSHSSNRTVSLAVERFKRSQSNKIPTTLRAVE